VPPATGEAGQGAGRLRPGWSRLRAQVLAEEPNCWCGERASTVDHRVARAFGGTDQRSNLRSLCPQHAAAKDLDDRVIGAKLDENDELEDNDEPGKGSESSEPHPDSALRANRARREEKLAKCA